MGTNEKFDLKDTEQKTTISKQSKKKEKKKN